MRLRHVELFQAVLQTGSLTAAAELLHISQPAASKILQHAEQQLGFTLFSRVRGKLLPTAEARILQQQTERLSAELQDLRRLSDSLRRGEERALRLVCTPALAQTLLSDAVCSWRKDFPQTRCVLATQHTSEIVQALLLREADLGLTLQRVEHPGLHTEVLAQGKMMAIAPLGWWSEDQCIAPIRLQSMAGLSLIGLDTRDALGGLLRGHIQELEPPVHIEISVQTYQLARMLVAAGQGLALVDPFTALADHLGDIQARPLEPNIPVPLYLLRRVDETPTTAQKALLKHLQTLAIDLLELHG
ncbi:MAG: LysR family transcriptional regulator [Kaiparowitsia implicata GSE-PSE-MK54-09C]|nr:LysR family transcriptional regulator [Kaiparowitsia implicata GSE-PSE-MK54-09C]